MNNYLIFGKIGTSQKEPKDDQIIKKDEFTLELEDWEFNPDGAYPEKIIDLTHADLVAFHQKHYHPSNATFFTFGNSFLQCPQSGPKNISNVYFAFTSYNLWIFPLVSFINGIPI